MKHPILLAANFGTSWGYWPESTQVVVLLVDFYDSEEIQHATILVGILGIWQITIYR